MPYVPHTERLDVLDLSMMSFVKAAPHSSLEPGTRPLTRPTFNHQNTQDRLREAAKRPTPFPMISNIRKDRRSIFKEVGLAPEDPGATNAPDENHAIADEREVSVQVQRPIALDAAKDNATTARTRIEDQRREETNDVQEKSEKPSAEPVGQRQSSLDLSRSKTVSMQSAATKTPWYAKLAAGRRPRVRTVGGPSPSPLHGLSVISMLALVLAVLIPFTGKGKQDTVGVADAGPIMLSRADSPTDVCTRWAMQCE